MSRDELVMMTTAAAWKSNNLHWKKMRKGRVKDCGQMWKANHNTVSTHSMFTCSWWWWWWPNTPQPIAPVLGLTGLAGNSPTFALYTKTAEQIIFTSSVLQNTVTFKLFFNYSETVCCRGKKMNTPQSWLSLSQFPFHLLWKWTILCKLNTKTFISPTPTLCSSILYCDWAWP